MLLEVSHKQKFAFNEFSVCVSLRRVSWNKQKRYGRVEFFWRLSFSLIRVYAPGSEKAQSPRAFSAQTVWKKSRLLLSRHHTNCEQRFRGVLNGGVWISG